VKKLEDKKTRLEAQLTKLNETVAKPDYLTKVPEGVRDQNAEKVPAYFFSLSLGY
jgi:hypothetical protein